MMTDTPPPLEPSEILITPGLEEAEGFGILPLRNLTVGQEVSFNVFLKIKKKGKTTSQFVKSCSRGEIFREDWFQKLVQLHIPCVYVSLEEMDRVMQYIHHHLGQVLADETQGEMEKGVRICDATHMWTINFFNNEAARTPEEIKGALQLLDTLSARIKSDRQILFRLLDTRRHKSFRLYTHCLNVSLLGLVFTKFLGWNQDKILGFGLGALIHDIGLIRAPRAVLEKTGTLTAEEMLEIKRHPLDGFRLVQGFVNLPWDALQIVLQHHENGDGSGYPKGSKTANIHTWARICRILDSYEAMTDKRPWREAMEPKVALWTMHSDWKRSKVFDQNYLASFIKFLAS